MYGQPYTGFGLTGFDNVTASTDHPERQHDHRTDHGDGTCDAQARCAFTAHWDDPVSKQPVTARISIG